VIILHRGEGEVAGREIRKSRVVLVMESTGCLFSGCYRLAYYEMGMKWNM